MRGLKNGSFSIGHFYERRILRIFPALFVVLLTVTLTATILLFPSDFDYFGETLSAAAAFGSNFIFWKESGYFEADSLTVPLLHTWSLAVEEQFYIFFPLIVMGIHKFKPKLVMPAIILALVISFTIAMAAVYTNSLAALFYLLPTRAWELLIGSALALSIVPPARNMLVANICGITGFALIVYAIFFYDEDTVFPGAAALVPTIGAALIIYSGLAHDSISRKWLGHKIPVFFGRISYSLYLWHWPIIVFFTYAAPTELTDAWRFGLLVACILLSYVSWRYIEQPLRYRTLVNRRKIFALSAAISLVFAAVGILIVKQDGFPQRFPKEIREMENVGTGDSFPLIKDTKNKDIKGSYNFRIGDTDSSPTFLVWGDSHTEAASPGLDIAAKKLGKSGYLMGVHSCVPAYRDVEIAIDDCNEINRGIVEFLEKHPELKTVILIGHWSNHYLHYAKRYKMGKTNSPTLWRDNLDYLFTKLEDQGRHIVFMIEMPHASVENVPLYLTRAMYYGSAKDVTFDLKTHKKRQEGITPVIEFLSSRHHFKIVDPSTTFCPQGKCPMEVGGIAVYTDNNHITTQGSRYYWDMYLPLLEP